MSTFQTPFPSQPYGPPTGPAPQGPAGTMSWALGLLGLIPVPIVGALVAGVVMAAVYRSQRRRGLVAEANARAAANWGLTLAGIALVIGVAIALIFVTQLDAERRLPPGPQAAVLVLLGVGSFGLSLVHLVGALVGIVKSQAGKVFRPVAIPFLGTPRATAPGYPYPA